MKKKKKKSADTKTLSCQLAYKFKFGQEIIKREYKKKRTDWVMNDPLSELCLPQASSSSRNINKYTTIG